MWLYSCSCTAAVVQLQLYNNSTSWGGNHPILWNPVGFCGILQDPMESCGIDGCETYPQTSPSRSGRRPTPEFPQTTVYSVLYCTVTVQCSILCSAVQYSTLYNPCTVQCTVLYCTVTLQYTVQCTVQYTVQRSIVQYTIHCTVQYTVLTVYCTLYSMYTIDIH